MKRSTAIAFVAACCGIGLVMVTEHTRTAAKLAEMAKQLNAAKEPKAASGNVESAEVQGYLEGVFASESGNAPWGRAALREAMERLGADLPQGSSVTSVDCHESLCRIETTHADVSRYRSFVRAAFIDQKTQLWNGGSFSTILSNRGTKGVPLVAVAYIAKDGQPLPTIPQ
jgi:hypothetical protein